MDSEILRKFEGKYVKLVLGDRYFKINGYLDEVSTDFILFRTTQKSSLINICEIREIDEINNGGNY